MGSFGFNRDHKTFTFAKTLVWKQDYTSFCDVTNNANQIQMTTLCRWMKLPHEKFLRTPLELDYISVSRLLLVPAVNVCETIKNWFELIYQNLSWLQYCVLLPCVWLRNILRKWFVTTVLTLPTHVLQLQNFVRIFCNDSEAIFRVFQLFSQEVKYFYQKNTWKNSQIIFI